MGPANSFGAVVRAFVYLEATSLYNLVRQRLLRLRQPKYLVGALVGGAYLYFFLFRRMAHVGGATGPRFVMPATLAADIALLVALGLLLYVLIDWLFVDSRANLGFSEAEIDFLFPAPVTRTTLIHFSLLRSQLAIFFSAFLLGLVLRRGGGLGGHPVQYACGIWLLLSTLKLHSLAASFTRDRLLNTGMRPWLRRLAAVVVALALVVACWWPMRGVLHWPAPEALSDLGQMRAWFEGIVGTAPLSWLLLPFRWMTAPIFATDGADFLRALGPALALLVLHYFWVVRAQVSFEDASIVHAQKRAERLAAFREGRMRQRRPKKARREPFRLMARGQSWVAFLWKGLLAMGPIYRLRVWLVACVATVALCRWLAADPALKPVLLAIGVGIPAIAGWLLVLAPMMMQHELRRTFERMDVLKALPLRGWQIALGELSSPTAVMCFGFWWLLLLAAQSVAVAHHVLTPMQVVSTAIGLALLAPPLFALMLCVPFAGMLYFPAWIVAPGAGGRGIEVMGQRMVFMFGYIFTVFLATLPAALLGGLGFLLGNWLGGWNTAVLLAAACACAVFAFELACALRLLGRRIDRFDLSQELR